MSGALDFNKLALAPCMQAFGEVVVYQPGAGAPVMLRGIFNRYASEDKVDSQTGEIRQVIVPTLALNCADFPAGMMQPVEAESVVIRGEVWAIASTMADNFGQLLLKLKKTQR